MDKMDDVKITTIKREGIDEFAARDREHYTNYTFNMYGGEVQKVTMVFQNRMLSTVLDRFGHSVMASPVDKSHFRITVPVAVSDQFYGWIFGLGNYVTIVGPDSVKEGMKKALAKVTKRYE
ncbi:MAG: WYL domain-containing protein [Clostridiales bacterium]|nr:WYL domain-containing protein [Clostridiales bacterium]